MQIKKILLLLLLTTITKTYQIIDLYIYLSCNIMQQTEFTEEFPKGEDYDVGDIKYYLKTQSYTSENSSEKKFQHGRGHFIEKGKICYQNHKILPIYYKENYSRFGNYVEKVNCVLKDKIDKFESVYSCKIENKDEMVVRNDKVIRYIANNDKKKISGVVLEFDFLGNYGMDDEDVYKIDEYGGDYDFEDYDFESFWNKNKILL